MKFNKKSIILLLQHVIDLRQGIPIDLHLTYLERPLATRSRRDHAPFEEPCLLIGELENRLKECGRDGFLVKIHYALEESEESIARNLGLSEEEVHRGIKMAIKYVSYKWPKIESYKEFRRKRR